MDIIFFKLQNDNQYKSKVQEDYTKKNLYNLKNMIVNYIWELVY